MWGDRDLLTAGGPDAIEVFISSAKSRWRKKQRGDGHRVAVST